jgi:hypothetical protein
VQPGVIILRCRCFCRLAAARRLDSDLEGAAE